MAERRRERRLNRPRSHRISQRELDEEIAATFADIERAAPDVDRIVKLWPYVAWQRLAQPASASTRLLPTSPRGWDYSDEGSMETHSDPTGETVCDGRTQPEAHDQRAQLEVLAALAAVHEAVVAFEKAAASLGVAAPT